MGLGLSPKSLKPASADAGVVEGSRWPR